MIVCSFDVKTLSKYDILVLVSNRLYLVLVIGLYTRYGYRNLFTSKGDGNMAASISSPASWSVYLSIYLARGRKRKLINFSVKIKSIDTYLPREGTETLN